ncbi:MAG: hypothetical protein AB1563_12450, partial [Bacillota bacterium]
MVVLSLVLVFSVAIRYPELPRTLGSAIAADFLRPPPDEVDGRKFVTSAVVGVSWLIAVEYGVTCIDGPLCDGAS